MVWRLSKSSERNRRDVRLELILVNDRALEISLYDFGIPNYGGLRTSKTQNKLYKQGVSKADGYIKFSDHQFGKALDFFGWKDGIATWDTEVLTHIACAHFKAANELGIKIGWGGFWKSFKDYPHIYLLE